MFTIGGMKYVKVNDCDAAFVEIALIRSKTFLVAFSGRGGVVQVIVSIMLSLLVYV